MSKLKVNKITDTTDGTGTINIDSTLIHGKTGDEYTLTLYGVLTSKSSINVDGTVHPDAYVKAPYITASVDSGTLAPNHTVGTEISFTGESAPWTDGTGVLSIKSITGSISEDNDGFIKIYIGTTAYWIPYFAEAKIT